MENRPIPRFLVTRRTNRIADLVFPLIPLASPETTEQYAAPLFSTADKARNFIARQSTDEQWQVRYLDYRHLLRLFRYLRASGSCELLLLDYSGERPSLVHGFKLQTARRAILKTLRRSEDLLIQGDAIEAASWATCI